jgi:hypothetical protein
MPTFAVVLPSFRAATGLGAAAFGAVVGTDVAVGSAAVGTNA